MIDFHALLTRIATLRERGVGGEALEDALEAVLSGDAIDGLRWLYVECEQQRALLRWALAELDAEVSELEELGAAA